MQLVQMSVEDYNKILKKLEDIDAKIGSKGNQNPLKDQWLDIQQVCQLLAISKRTLFSYKANNILNYSKLNGKVYYKASDIDALLEQNYSKKSNKV